MAIDFTVEIVTPPINIIVEIPVIASNGSSSPATVKNSTNTFNQSVAPGATYTVPDTIINILLDGVPNVSTTAPALENLTLNITA